MILEHPDQPLIIQNILVLFVSIRVFSTLPIRLDQLLPLFVCEVFKLFVEDEIGIGYRRRLTLHWNGLRLLKPLAWKAVVPQVAAQRRHCPYTGGNEKQENNGHIISKTSGCLLSYHEFLLCLQIVH